MFVKKILDYEFTICKKENYWIVSTHCVGATYSTATNFHPLEVKNETQLNDLFDKFCVRVVDVAESIYLLFDNPGLCFISVELKNEDPETAEIQLLKNQIRDLQDQNKRLLEVIHGAARSIYPRNRF